MHMDTNGGWKNERSLPWLRLMRHNWSEVGDRELVCGKKLLRWSRLLTYSLRSIGGRRVKYCEPVYSFIKISLLTFSRALQDYLMDGVEVGAQDLLCGRWLNVCMFGLAEKMTTVSRHSNPVTIFTNMVQRRSHRLSLKDHLKPPSA